MPVYSDSNPDHILVSQRSGLLSLVYKGTEQLILAHGSIIVLVHGLEVLDELCLIKFGIGFDAMEHLDAELANFALLELTVLVDVNLGKQFLGCL